MIDYDIIEEWSPSLSVALSERLPQDISNLLAARAPKFAEDARDILFDLGDRDAIIDATLEWIRSSTVAGYHGSRLTEKEIVSIRESGLLPLQADTRRVRLIRALSPHPRWGAVADQLDFVLDTYGQGQSAGRREGQVHLTLSRSGLTDGFNHYLTHGSEFDQHVAHALLGLEGQEFLARDGTPTLLKFRVPGTTALDASHPIFGIDDVRDRGNVPNVVNEFLKAWGYALAYPGFQPKSLQVDCGLLFRTCVPPQWLDSIEVFDFELPE